MKVQIMILSDDNTLVDYKEFGAFKKLSVNYPIGSQAVEGDKMLVGYAFIPTVLPAKKS